MGEVSTIGLDLAKRVFQVHGIDAAGRVLVRRQTLRHNFDCAFRFLAATGKELAGLSGRQVSEVVVMRSKFDRCRRRSFGPLAGVPASARARAPPGIRG
jgi:hypothetical protein